MGLKTNFLKQKFPLKNNKILAEKISRCHFFILASQNSVNDAPPPPERGSSYAVMSQQSALRSNGSTASNLPPASQQPASMKRVSFHDSNANSESVLRNMSSGTSNPPSMSMDIIREDPNVSLSFFYPCVQSTKFFYFYPVNTILINLFILERENGGQGCCFQIMFNYIWT